jgi:hypothetical protein
LRTEGHGVCFLEIHNVCDGNDTWSISAVECRQYLIQ